MSINGRTMNHKEDEEHRRFNPLDLIFAPVSCLTHVSPIILLFMLTILGGSGVIGYFTLNTNLFGLIGPDFSEMTVIGSYEGFAESTTRLWLISYEYNHDSVFEGKVSKVYPIREGMFSILTHDILVTSGDYANPELVTVSVFNHHFTWKTANPSPIPGTINLLHTVPMNEDIYEQLLKIRDGDQVKITGREILRINAQREGNTAAYWEDDGCNTLLVTSVEFLN